ncbi:MFS transporter [Kribbia dieselivorans]|uniref:MFS transporter n=1 Tax=Kribbia dieselivorans TaxID=331526 RepID=UPI0009FAF707|nr:MFS transporter [Kribbia dieselivorans]
MALFPPVGRTFAHLLLNTAVAGLTTSFLWFALTFWAYLETRSVLATGIVGGAYMLFVSASSILFGSIVDHHRKIVVMRASTIVTLVLFAAAGVFALQVPDDRLTDLSRPWFWIFAALILIGAIVEHLRNIALSTCVTILVPDAERDRANGLVGTAQGITFLATSAVSGLSVGFLGMRWTLVLATLVVAAGLVHLLVIRMPQEPVPAAAASDDHGRVDLAGSLAVIRAQAGLFALIIFSTFNNLVGGVYLALMDPYGLEMFSVQMWGFVMAASSVGFILGGFAIARTGLGPKPVRTMLLCVIAMGLIGGLFTAREWWWLYGLGLFAYMCLVPAVEAAEQTVIQRVVPLERQGRIFGFSMAVETAAAPLTAFLIAPITANWVIPYAASAEGRAALEPWLGIGTPTSRGIALVFLVAGMIMAVVAALAMVSPSYRHLEATYATTAPRDDVIPELGAAGLPEFGAPGEVVGSASSSVALSMPQRPWETEPDDRDPA